MEGEFQKEHLEHLNVDLIFFKKKLKIHDPFQISSKVIEDLCREKQEKQLPSLPLHLPALPLFRMSCMTS